MAVKKVVAPEDKRKLLMAELKEFDVIGKMSLPEKDITYIRRAMKNHNKLHAEAPIPEELIEKLKQIEDHLHEARSIALRLFLK